MQFSLQSAQCAPSSATHRVDDLRAARAAVRGSPRAPVALPVVLPAIMLALPDAFVRANRRLAGLQHEPGPNGGTTYSLSVQTMLLLTMLSFLPAMVLMMTSFTRIIIVLSLLRQALGTATTPPNQVLVGLALFLHAVRDVAGARQALIPTATSPSPKAPMPMEHGREPRPRAVQDVHAASDARKRSRAVRAHLHAGADARSGRRAAVAAGAVVRHERTEDRASRSASRSSFRFSSSTWWWRAC